MAKAKKRGRPRQPNPKRRCTTRQGRKTGFDPQDRGTAELQARKRTLTGRVDLPIDPSAVLFARAHLDRAAFDRIAEIGELLRQVARGWGLKADSVDGLWTALMAAASRTAFSATSTTPAGAEAARRRLERTLRRLDGSKDLVLALAEHRITPIIVRAWSHRTTPDDAVVLERLRTALDRLPGVRGPG